MKLSKKGAEKISTNCKNVTVIGTDDFFPPTILEGADKLEFEQSDFTGAVVLTVEEAELVNEVLDRFKHLGGGPFFGRCIRLSKSIQQRIEQVEKSNA